MCGGVVNGETVPNLAAHLLAEDIHQRLALVDVEVIHDQVSGVNYFSLQGILIVANQGRK